MFTHLSIYASSIISLAPKYELVPFLQSSNISTHILTDALVGNPIHSGQGHPQTVYSIFPSLKQNLWLFSFVFFDTRGHLRTSSPNSGIFNVS